MSRFLVVEFKDEATAYKGTDALQELNKDGHITVYDAAVIKKQDDGTVKLLDERDEGFIGTALGTLTGSLIGLIGGAAGVAAGMLGGGTVGWLSDMENLGVGSDFVDEVGTKLKKGSVAIVAEVEEYWGAPVDTEMGELGGKIYRKERYDYVDERRMKEIEEKQEQIKEFKEELADADARAKSTIEKSIDNLKKDIKKTGDKIEKQLKRLYDEGTEHLAKMKDAYEKSSEKQKKRIKARIAKAEKANEERIEKVKQYAQATKDALTD